MNSTSLYGDGLEEVVYGGSDRSASVRRLGHDAARFELGPAEAIDAVVIPQEMSAATTALRGSPELTLNEIAPHLFTIELPSLNTRVTVAEFADYLVVIEEPTTQPSVTRSVQAIRSRLPEADPVSRVQPPSRAVHRKHAELHRRGRHHHRPGDDRSHDRGDGARAAHAPAGRRSPPGPVRPRSSA